ncbi:sigma-70 family RNA polymerase sigma factor [Geovibrio thiophilus]|uniref:Sigma-70 family RNA polymerase sigma factor n=1 Tax=Geovibrio thiophilus TaxID=139438 RepID=A0A3R5XY83_9BACT|nr:sigma-70 family RNA polymerase sigma factor [Geovibrio thiophilus]QAR33672.1 sigma-70 family RNA polymerase sigma factor [Geovibrio thiophilus]
MCSKLQPDISDRELIERLVCGEYEYFRVFVKRFESLVFETVGRHVPEDMTEDVAQEVFIKVFKSLKTLDNSEKVKGWLKKVSINCCCDYWRREYRKNETSLSSLSYEGGNLLERLESESAGDEFERKSRQTHLRMILDRAMLVLSPKDRILMELVYFDGVSAAEAADVMNMTRAGVKVRAFRAKKKLSDALKRMGIRDSNYE